MKFAEVLLPLPIYGTFTYSVPEEMQPVAGIGYRVVVPFGRKKFYTGVITLLHNNKPEGYEVKDILSVLDNHSILRHPQLKFWQWIADYYLCAPGDVLKAALPAGMKVESETRVNANVDYVDTDSSLNERELIIYNYLLTKSNITPGEISRATGFKNVEQIVTRMIEKEAVIVCEKIVDNYRPKTEVCVKLTADKGDNEALQKMFDMVKQAKKQEATLSAYLHLSEWLKKGNPKPVTKDALIARAGSSLTIINAMKTKGIFQLYKREVNRFHIDDNIEVKLNSLSQPQQEALTDIRNQMKEKNVVLLHGVTSSGKTEVYTHLIDSVLRSGLQVLYLVPEIALTTQLTQRLYRNFGNRLLIYHSKFSDNERVDIWKQLLNDQTPKVVIGVRSSVFLPFSKLGLVIIDEEHETSFKQQDPAPRYNARNAALVLASMHGAKTLLGSATPSVETYYNALSGKYGLVSLSTRYEGVELPIVETVDTKKARKKHLMRGAFSVSLIDECNEALLRGEQAIIFQNRRGFAPLVRCKECAWTPKCVNCDVSLTYHKRFNQLVCHYCGAMQPLPSICPACGQPTIEVLGYGTERLEDDIEQYFPGVKIARMDLDTTRSKTGYDKIIENFSKGQTRVLVGTQMVTKGLDFEGVSVVGIVNADNMINYPDFRSHERSFNMLEQVAGRAGRRKKQGLVLIQTSMPDHPIIKFVKAHDYEGFYNAEIEERRRYGYPPFTRIINIYVKHRDDNIVTELSVMFSNLLRKVFGERVLGPEAPVVARVQQLFIRQIVLKVETTASMSKVKQALRQIYLHSLADARMKSAIIYYDVDPS